MIIISRLEIIEDGTEVLMLFSPKEVEKGQSMVEVALLIVMIAAVVIVILSTMNPYLGDIYSTIIDAL
jgi:Flp pilus assembly pilin Flp